MEDSDDPMLEGEEEGDLLLGGGTDEWSGSDLIYRYDTTEDSWELLEAKLPGAVTGVAATMVNSYIFPSCE